VSSLERLGEAGWLPAVRSEESLPGQACNQPMALYILHLPSPMQLQTFFPTL
jgi:hypothetical protein